MCWYVGNRQSPMLNECHESLPVFRAVLQGDVQVLLMLETSDSVLAASMMMVTDDDDH